MTMDAELLNRIRMEFIEMPGLALTRQQATRLWQLDAGVCARVLDHLVCERFLTERPGGRFMRWSGYTVCR